MSNSEINVKILRFSREIGKEPYYQTYRVPLNERMSVSNILQFINERYDGGLAFYQSCRCGLCKGCVVMVNGKSVLSCTKIVTGDIVVEPRDRKKVIKDLVGY
ncbi:MAG: succinate dehydrogenase [Deltaproteobacteria bacterium]|nr:MAG: succinate dehydrogenase [Deltaproteobacteria bacterium]